MLSEKKTDTITIYRFFLCSASFVLFLVRSKYKGLNNKLLTDIIKTGHLIFHFDGYFSNLSKFWQLLQFWQLLHTDNGNAAMATFVQEFILVFQYF